MTMPQRLPASAVDRTNIQPIERVCSRPVSPAWRQCLRGLFMAGTLTLTVACGSSWYSDGIAPGTDNAPTSNHPGANDPIPEAPENQTTVTGIVVDGPVAGALVVILDADGNELATEVTDNRARFTAFIPADAVYPLTLFATGGVNLTTDADPGFRLEGVIAEAKQQRVVLSAFSTLALKRAECAAVEAGEAREQRVQRLLADPDVLALLKRYEFGLDASVTDHFLTALPTEPAAAASLLLGSEALIEAVRRATAALNAAGAPISIEELLWEVACDLEDGRLDAASVGTDPARIAAFHTALASVLTEAALGELWIASREIDAVELLEQAVVDTFGLNRAPDLGSQPLSEGSLEVLLRSVHASLALAPSDALFDLYAELFALSQDAPRATLRERLDPQALRAAMAGLLTDVASDPALAASVLELNALATANMLPPQLNLSATPQSLPTRGTESTTLSHTSEHATVCQRVNGFGGWAGLTRSADEQLVGPIERAETFTLRCAGPGGVAEQSLDILVPPDVRVRFLRADGSLANTSEPGETLTVRFELFDVTAKQCEFRRTDTQASVSDGDTLTAADGLAINIHCEGLGGNFINSTPLPLSTVPVSLAWARPNQRENGQPLSDLIGYRIYHGSASGNYDGGYVNVDDPEQLTAIIDVPPGNRYVAITALTADGLESRFSNEGFTYIH